MSSAKQVLTHLSPTNNSTTIDQYDHAISLVDSTRPSTPPPEPEAPDSPQSSSRNSNSIPRLSVEESVPVARIWSRTGLSKELTRRKYARFQEHRYSQDDGSESIKSRGQGQTVLRSLNDRKARALERLHIRPRQAGKAKNLESIVDILYENQRGLFIFGYPLYSSKSLLNFDPGAWTDTQFQDSAVDIRNAQVPDPTWMWSWKRWYVDMSGDVDEQGWEYSLTFGKTFSWHGTHPWFHSAVRRRRWLRKRVKIQHTTHSADAHDMTQDYFTIHSRRRDRSRGSSIASKTADRTSRYSGRFEAAEASEDEGEIDNVVSLLRVMKDASVDRKKIQAFKSFISHGGDDLQLLPNILPEVWNLLLYQHSRRELSSILEDTVQELMRGKESQAEGSTSKSANLQAALEVIRNNLSEIEFYSDIKAVDMELSKHGFKDSQQRGASAEDGAESTTFSLKGIPQNAGLDMEPGIARPRGTGLHDNEAE
ncbi:MAG: hypothetical protein GOMPHAMPRED_006597 [Gomphillus americanus]|uniref:Peroxin/Ferlin domain-containing protein n=1 Tax=Gomphillus americanus TaxID=1940652 RepID=A0A8H3FWU8_9LECA|nr:MAG: hypothetical protein GOMPHAMPRED_006597 [Gomphillus americanus]